jgi:hypothetical protein
MRRRVLLKASLLAASRIESSPPTFVIVHAPVGVGASIDATKSNKQFRELAEPAADRAVRGSYP